MKRRVIIVWLAAGCVWGATGLAWGQAAFEPALPEFNPPALPELAIPEVFDTAFPGEEAADSGTGGGIILRIDGLGERQQVSSAIKVLALMTALTLAPAFLIMLTAFTRIVIVLGFIKRALSTTEVPPQQVVIGLALFLTFFVMAPTWTLINDEAIQPYLNEQIDEAQAFGLAEGHVRDFLFKHTRSADLSLMLEMSGRDVPESLDEVPSYVLAPAFMLSELKTAFTIGFIIFIPFLILDMVVASILLSMGMMMLPPVIVSLPFKIILFVLVDGWNLIVGELLRSFG